MSNHEPQDLCTADEAADLAAVDIAQALYVSPSHVSRWKTGSRS